MLTSEENASKDDETGGGSVRAIGITLTKEDIDKTAKKIEECKRLMSDYFALLLNGYLGCCYRSDTADRLLGEAARRSEEKGAVE